MDSLPVSPRSRPSFPTVAVPDGFPHPPRPDIITTPLCSSIHRSLTDQPHQFHPTNHCIPQPARRNHHGRPGAPSLTFPLPPSCCSCSSTATALKRGNLQHNNHHRRGSDQSPAGARTGVGPRPRASLKPTGGAQRAVAAAAGQPGAAGGRDRGRERGRTDAGAGRREQRGRGVLRGGGPEGAQGDE